ncbi:MAG: FtsH protease activity modulator HflK [Alphaproteobacteria bacterium CG_4_10_14_0_8_um_filter_37_21]|nr:MAG: FtsH protease activity modulator HflK [Alphaproteobacteria bacterium CG_4_10_14_0_8_um_filter_37_21]
MFLDDDNESENPWDQPKVTKIDEKASSKSKPKKTSTKKKDDLPEPLGDFMSKLKEKVNQQNASFKRSGNGGSGPEFPTFSTIHLGLIIVGVIFLWLASGVYQVEEGAQSAVLRFGTPARISGPGLNYRLPWPFEANYVLRTAAENRIESSSRTARRDDISFTLTGDENMITTNYVVLWKIKNISDFLFTNKEPQITIRAASESAMREVIGQKTFPSVLTANRTETAHQIMKILQDILDSYQIGVEITSFELQSLTPPSEVSDSFQDMQTSSIDAQRMKREAEAYTNDIIPKARGYAVKMIESSKAYSQDVVGKAKGEAAQFDLIYNAYKENKLVTLKRYYLEGMQRTLGNIRNKTIVDASLGNSILPHVSLDKKTK